jgi:hypothetical protein
MYKSRLRAWSLIAVFAMWMLSLPLATAGDDSSLSKEEIKQFLLTAKIIGVKGTPKGITQPLRLTLSDGKVTHDASYQVVDEHKDVLKMADGHSELNFVDSYKYNIAAYRLAEMLGVDDMMPVYVERKYIHGPGSLSWWLPVKMDEADRVKNKIDVPDADAWNNQMYRIRVFDELVYDIDANLTNVLIGEDWKIWRVDFTRAFRLNNNLRDTKNLVRCDRQLLEKLKALNGDQLAQNTKGYLTKGEVKAVMQRRDKIVARFAQLIQEKGETAVMY